MDFIMAATDYSEGRKRTAVLVVHGIGSQRALETVRGVIRAVWLNEDNPNDKGKRIWTHPERDGSDIDLAVMTTNAVPNSADKRSVDFHELYWAHLMSETRAVAVLLWLYELCRKGPILKPGINGLWWAAAIFLCLMNLSFAVLALQAIFLFSRHTAQTMLIAPFLLLFSSLLLSLVVASRWKAARLVKPLALACAAAVVAIVAYLLIESRWPGDDTIPDVAEIVAVIALPTMLALLATMLVMGRQGMRAFWRALVISVVIAAIFIVVDRYWYPDTRFAETLIKAWPWGLTSPWSVDVACAVIGIYLAVNAAFLQPYLGDAARYFRNSPANVAVRRAIRTEAVNTLDRLHSCGRYDRVVVVAHSLGCVVSYDMLRACFSRTCDELPPTDQLGSDFADIDAAAWQPDDPAASIEDKKELRRKARNAIAQIAQVSVGPVAEQGKYQRWLVTDFVTLGSALTHAYFLMCVGKPGNEPKPDVERRRELQEDFARRVREREFPTCPPKRLDSDGLLTFDNPRTKRKTVHNGAVFGLTRWTNIYFPRRQLFWGDAIGGGLSPIFGYHIIDREVSTRKAGGDDFFSHTAYWDVHRTPDTYEAPHIVALCEAVDLADTGSAVALVDKGVDPQQHEAE